MKYPITILLIIVAKVVFGQHVTGIHVSNCDTNCNVVYMHNIRLISKDIADDTLKLKIGLVRRCSGEPGIELDLKGDSLIIAIQKDFISFKPHRCYFEIDIDAVGVKDTSFTLFEKHTRSQGDSLIPTEEGLAFLTEKEVVEYNEIKEYPTKYKFPLLSEIEAAPKDNQLNNDRLKVGYWVIRNKKTTNIESKAHYFIHENGKSIVSWYATYDKEGILMEVCAFGGIDPEGYPWYSCLNLEQYLKLNMEEP